jgi:NADPH:quinone reductase-like Zn-dependent oxidoreductase
MAEQDERAARPLLGKVALVSGGARGIGEAIVRILAERGAQVVCGDLRREEGGRLADELGDAVAFVPLDVTESAQWDAAVDAAVTRFGHLDVLVNNAGIAIFESVGSMSSEVWDSVMAVTRPAPSSASAPPPLIWWPRRRRRSSTSRRPPGCGATRAVRRTPRPSSPSAG